MFAMFLISLSAVFGCVALQESETDPLGEKALGAWIMFGILGLGALLSLVLREVV